MLLLVLFAFLSGVITVLSPCILPILPVILSSGLSGANLSFARPLGVVTGFVVSFTFFTLFLTSLVRLTGLPADLLRSISIVVIAGVGISLLVPQFQALLEKLFTRIANFLPRTQNKTGFSGGLLIGFSVGLLWTPCVGPILASVISLAITGAVTFDSFLITAAYSLGTAIPMLLIMIGGQNALRRIPQLTKNLSAIQKFFAVLMILTAVGIFFNLDRRFQTFILERFPNYGIGLTKLEDTAAVKTELGKLGDPGANLPTSSKTPAPEIIPGGVWFNSAPLSLAQLKGKVVLLDFWTYTCINCQRTLPYLRSWYSKYRDKGLVIIGVHSPEFEFEKNPANVARAIADFNLTYPVVQDNDFATWRAYKNRFWPAKYFIDADGFVRYSHFGEGDYDRSESVIQELLKEAGAREISDSVANPEYQIYAKTPETYLGFGRIDGFVSPQAIARNTPSPYTAPSPLPPNSLAFAGTWTVMQEYANPGQGANLYFNFESKEVYLVMRSKSPAASVRVYLDGQAQFLGADAGSGVVTVDSDRLYKLINLPAAGRHLLRLEFLDSNLELFAFTFG